ncbi:endonuclease [Hymenobacter persicinus]|uniref:Endonuclease n=1 Tax=Hymenobacter persicinus TaxID=2025506 RepID=A0A4Q5LEI9_9BACT|nr:endonuclease [Hymenobacter persicinus]
MLGRCVVLVLGAAAILATLLPLLKEEAWWIRVFDFPRLQIIGVALLSALAAALVHLESWPGGWVAMGAMAAVGAYQLYRVIPYTPFVRKQAADATLLGPDKHLSLAVMNVLQYNKQAQRALGVIQACDPDVIMAVETDQWWLDQLRPLEKTHPYTCHEPLENTYGLLFFSRLPLRDARIEYLLDDDIPSVHAHVQIPGTDTWVRLYGLHPKPPAPAESKTSTKRDAELLLVGKAIEEKDEPTIVFGDMNDVAWSHTSELFRRVSGLLDPRVGRGMLPTFHAEYRLLRWPLDHVFISPDFKVANIERLPYVGSDHFPICIKVSYEPHAKAEQEQNAEQADAEDEQEAQEKIEKGFEEEEQQEAEEQRTPAEAALKLSH